jgi:hypothetical protein
MEIMMIDSSAAHSIERRGRKRGPMIVECRDAQGAVEELWIQRRANDREGDLIERSLA